jgi:uncharacterized membrane protein
MSKYKLTNCLPKTIIAFAMILANVAYLTHSFIGWVVTLSFFLLLPGYLLLSSMKHGIKSLWEIGSLSLGLSTLVLMVSGLILNSLHAFGLRRPLDTINIFTTLDIVTFLLLTFVPSKKIKIALPKLKTTSEEVVVALLLTLLPLLAMFGAFRLNNGASDILTMVLFAAIPTLFMWLVCRRSKLETLFPYAVFMFGLSVLLSTSLRGWFITGHDIQHEFKVFQIASRNSYWNLAVPKGDPYNACLSITILPTIIAKITSISAPYIYKIVFQVIFAFGLIPIYSLIKRFASGWKAITGALIFISFPTFLNDMPFLNRQGMAFVFFGLLLLITFHEMERRPKTALTILTLFGLILSHYSSGYITICLLALAWLFFKVLTYHRLSWQQFILPVLSVPILTLSLLFTFLWNAQITSTTSNLRQAISQTADGLLGQSESQSSGVSYSIFAPHTKSPSEVLADYAGNKSSQVHYVSSSNLPITTLGKTVSKIIKVETLNNLLRSFSAKIFQLLLLLGVAVLFFGHLKKKSAKETYFLALSHSCVLALILITILPALSVDYSVTRLFQQTIIITALPIILAAEYLLDFVGHYKIYIISLFFAFLFLDLSGFMPQLLGGYPPQLALNNAGTYFDIYYTHTGELESYSWLGSISMGEGVVMDSYAKGRVTQTGIDAWITVPLSSSAHDSTYLYQDYANMHNSAYGTYQGGDVIEYSYPSLQQNTSRIYVNQSSQVYKFNH